MRCRRAYSLKLRLRIQIKLPIQIKRGSAMRYWSQAAVLVVIISVLGNAQTRFVQNAFVRPYRVKPVPPVYFRNSHRILEPMRAGQLHLSSADAISLALDD